MAVGLNVWLEDEREFNVSKCYTLQPLANLGVTSIYVTYAYNRAEGGVHIDTVNLIRGDKEELLSDEDLERLNNEHEFHGADIYTTVYDSVCENEFSTLR